MITKEHVDYLNTIADLVSYGIITHSRGEKAATRLMDLLDRQLVNESTSHIPGVTKIMDKNETPAY